MSVMPVASIARPLRLRKREDLQVFRLRFASQNCWGVKDAISLRYFQLTDEEHFVLNSLDGLKSVAEIQQQFGETFAPVRLTISQIQRYLGLLYDSGLIISETSGQAEPLLERDRQRRGRELSESIFRLLALRFRGIDAEWLLSPLYRWTRWLFSWMAQAVLASFVIAAIVLVFVRFPVLVARLPDAQSFFGVENLFALVATLALTKILHELGHGLTCKHFGGECHEMGLMLLAATPCLYCNVTDAWTFPGKWKRIAVSIAGIWVELILAAICTFLWWFSEPGWLNATCLNLMVVCSISTVFINGNPLLRYDAYYVLSDLVEIPNLGPRAARTWKERLADFFLPSGHGDDRTAEPNGWFLFSYGMAAATYRVVLLCGLLLVAHRLLKPYHLESIAWMTMILALGMLLRTSIVEFTTLIADPQRRANFMKPHVLFRWFAAMLVLAALLLVPLPHRVSAPLVVEPEGATAVYVRVPGIVIETIPEGTRVNEGDVIARLENLELVREIEQLRGRTAQQRLHLENLRRRQSTDSHAAAEIPTAAEIIADLEERLRQKRVEEERLLIRAPAAGIVLPSHNRESQGDESIFGRLNVSPLDPEKAGSYLEVGIELCLIGDPERVEAMLDIDQGDMEFVREGQSVRLILDERPAEVLRGVVMELAEVDAQGKSASLQEVRNSVLPGIERSDLESTTSRSYRARVSFDRQGFRCLPGGAGRAKVHATALPLGKRMARFLTRTFRLEL